MLIQFEIFSGDELNKPLASVQILLLLYTTYSMYITCVIEIKYVYTKAKKWVCRRLIFRATVHKMPDLLFL